MGGQIAVQALGVPGRDFQLLVADELGPAEAEGAIGVAGLALAGKEQDGFAVFVLQSLEDFGFVGGNVEFALPGRMGIEAGADFRGRAVDFLPWSIADQKVRNAPVVVLSQHPPLRENQLVERIVGHPVPVDQMFDHVAVGPERQHGADNAHVEQIVGGHIPELGHRVQILAG